MTKRYLWTIVSAALCVGASPTGASAANAPDDWVCNEGKGECDDIVVRFSLPDNTNEVRHLIKDARFSILDKGSGTYALDFRSSEWLAPFLSATIEWVKGKDLLPDHLCKDQRMASILEKSPAKKDVRDPPEYSYFISSLIPIHLDGKKPPKVQEHTWYIFPIEDEYGDGTHMYCLSFKKLGGGSHDGAVHGDG